MKKLIYIGVFACLIIAFSVACKKNTDVDNSPKLETYDGDEYDKGLVVEEPEEVEEAEETDYDPEATTKIDSIVSRTKITAAQDGCTTYKYTGYHRLNSSSEIDVYLSADDSIPSIATNNVNVTGQIIEVINSRHITITLEAPPATIKERSIQVKLTNSTGKVLKKSIKCVGSSEDYFYGQAGWLVSQLATYQGNDYDITSSYVPQINDIFKYSQSGGNPMFGYVLNTPIEVTTKGITYIKFKLREMNAKCTGRISTKSMKIEKSKIGDGIASYKGGTYMAYMRL